MEDNNKTNSQNGEISIIDILMLLLANWKLIAIAAVVCAVAGFIFAKVTYVPVYTSEGTLYVDSQSASTRSDINQSAINSSMMMVPTYIEILNSKTFLENVESDVDGKYAPEEIKRMMSLSSKDETNLVKVSVSAMDSHDAYAICSSIISHAPDELTRVIAAGSAKIVDFAEEPLLPNGSGAVKKTFICFWLGAIIACAFVFVRELLDSRIKSADDLSSKYSIPILGEIPDLMEGN